MSLGEGLGGAETAPPQERPLTTLLADLASSMTALVGKEVELAKAELSDKANQLGRALGQLAVGGAVLLCGVLALLAAAILGLSQVLTPWLAALCVGLAVTLIGFALVAAGRSKLRAAALRPQRTIGNVRQDVRELTDAVTR